MDDASAALTVQFPAPSERSRRRGGRHLKAVSPQRRRRSTAIPVLVGAAVVFLGMFAVAGMHAFLIDGQIELDALQREVASESEAVERLRLAVAELEAPDRILSVAQERLGMQEPGEIGYVLPEGSADSASLLRVPPATVPPPPTTAPPVVVQDQTDPQDGTSTIDDAVAAALASAGITPSSSSDAAPADAPESDDGAAGAETEPETPAATGAGE